jgi:hypothetical protein
LEELMTVTLKGIFEQVVNYDFGWFIELSIYLVFLGMAWSSWGYIVRGVKHRYVEPGFMTSGAFERFQLAFGVIYWTLAVGIAVFIVGWVEN